MTAFVGVGSDPWPSAAVGAGIAIVIVALVPLRISTTFSRRSRYFKVRSALYALAGIGVAIGHWSAAVGATIIGLAILGIVFVVALRRHLLPDR